MRTEVVIEHSLAFDHWFERFLEHYLRWNPIDATFLGITRFDHELPDYVAETDTDRIAQTRDLIAQLDALPFAGSTETQILDRSLARVFLELQLWETGSRFFQTGNPSHHVREAIFGIASLFEHDTEPIEERIEAATARLRGLPDFLATARDRIASAPLIWTDCALRESESAIGYFRHDIRFIALDRRTGRNEFLRQTDLAADAFTQHAHWLRAVLTERRIPFRPAGTDIFDYLLHRGHFLPAEQTTGWWFDYAHAELIETTRELRELAQSIDWKRSTRQQFADLTRQHPSVAEYYGTFGRCWRERREQTITADLVTWPDAELQFQPVPPTERSLVRHLRYPLIRYSRPFGCATTPRMLTPPCDLNMSVDDQQAILRQMPEIRIDLDFAVRHGGLGRFVQYDHALRSHSRIGRIAGVESARNRVMFCSGTLVDGWMGYATELLEEIGVLTDQQRLWEARRRVQIAARAIADTAIHSGEFTVERTARFLRDEAWMPATEALDEAVTLSMFPGTGVAALAGLAAIDELRRRLEDRDGPDFSLHAFHDRLLGYGAIPVTLIAASMLDEVG